MLYPSLAMQADQLAIAFLIEPSATSALPMSLFSVSMMAIEWANWALLKLSRMLKHLPAAAWAPAGMPANGAPGWPGPPAAPPARRQGGSARKPCWAASAVPI